ncbi:MAG: response regulator transcription factor [Bacteroidota bacterium]|nr:response regulator transcription factor [Bacteroidota bacterium]
MIKILIADDHPLIREGLKKTLKEETDMKVVCEAKNGSEVLDLINKNKVDVIVMDLSMPGLSGLETMKELKKQSSDLPVLILSMHPEERFAIRALKAGASGYLTKDNAPQGLAEAIRKVVRGGRYITPSLAEKLSFEIETNCKKQPHELLSDREFQIFCLIASGKSIKEISDMLFLSINTVNTYRVRILEKMNMKTNIEITHHAIRHHLID